MNETNSTTNAILVILLVVVVGFVVWYMVGQRRMVPVESDTDNAVIQVDLPGTGGGSNSPSNQ